MCLFDLILYVPSTIFQLNRDGISWVEPVLSLDKCVLLKDNNAMTPARLEPSVSSQTLYHLATARPRKIIFEYGHVAYQIDGDDDSNRMQVNFSP